VGQKVKQHHYIGRVGSTGRTTGPHLHFTIWKNGKLQNPLKYLW
jgi:murein DD-endopeptidase MepM/ murein hydrolase activator NlpD